MRGTNASESLKKLLSVYYFYAIETGNETSSLLFYIYHTYCYFAIDFGVNEEPNK